MIHNKDERWIKYVYMYLKTAPNTVSDLILKHYFFNKESYIAQLNSIISEKDKQLDSFLKKVPKKISSK